MTRFWGALFFGLGLLIFGLGLVDGMQNPFSIRVLSAFFGAGLSLFFGVFFWEEK